MSHRALRSDDPLHCVVCRRSIFWIVEGDRRVYHHVEELTNPRLVRVHRALKDLLLPWPIVLRRGQLYDELRYRKLVTSPDDFDRILDELVERGKVRIVDHDTYHSLQVVE